MWLSLAPLPPAGTPTYCIHQYVWSYFGGAGNATRPFLYRVLSNGILMLSSRPPSCPSVFIGDRLEAGRVYQFEADVSATRKLRPDNTCRQRVALFDNAERREWLTRLAQGVEIRFATFKTLEKVKIYRSQREAVIFHPCRVQGTLYVQDRAQCLEWLLKGVGRERIFGYGLIYLRELMAPALEQLWKR